MIMQVILNGDWALKFVFNDEVKSFNFKMEFNNYEWFYNNYLGDLNGFYNITLLRTYDAHFKIRFPRPKERAIKLRCL